MKNCVSCALRIVLGLIITAFGYWAFLNPHSISVGGITGACVVLNEHFGLPYTGTLLFLNTALFLWGIKVKGMGYVVRSLCAMVALGILLDLQIPVLPIFMTVSKQLAMVLGSILTGIGYGVIVATNTSTGGSDLLAMIVIKKIPRMTVGMIMNGVDLLVVLASGIFDGMQNILFSIAAMLLCNTFIDVTSYCFGSCALPTWMLHLKKCGQTLFKSRVHLHPGYVRYAVPVAACIFLLMIREVDFLKFVFENLSV